MIACSEACDSRDLHQASVQKRRDPIAYVFNIRISSPRTTLTSSRFVGSISLRVHHPRQVGSVEGMLPHPARGRCVPATDTCKGWSCTSRKPHRVISALIGTPIGIFRSRLFDSFRGQDRREWHAPASDGHRPRATFAARMTNSVPPRTWIPWIALPSLRRDRHLLGPVRGRRRKDNPIASSVFRDPKSPGSSVDASRSIPRPWFPFDFVRPGSVEGRLSERTTGCIRDRSGTPIPASDPSIGSAGGVVAGPSTTGTESRSRPGCVSFDPFHLRRRRVAWTRRRKRKGRRIRFVRLGGS